MNADETYDIQQTMSQAHHDFDRLLNSHAAYKVSNKSQGEDLVQETFMKTWRYLARGGKIETMKAFLYHVLDHLIIDEYRKQGSLSLDVMLEKGFEPSVDPSERLINSVDAKQALPLIERLPEKYKKVIRMRYIQELSLKEMSLITGQTKNTLAVQAYRGLKKLRLLYRPV